MTTAQTIDANEKLISVDSHVLYTNDWVTERLPKRLQKKWIEGSDLFQRQQHEKRGGFTPSIVDLFEPEAWNDPGHTEPHAKIKSMDRDGVYAEVIFPEVGAARVCSPGIMGDDWQDMLSGFNDAVADFASVNTERLMCAYQLLPFDVDASIKEVQRVAARGAKCIQLPAFPNELGLKDYHDEGYDRLWSAIQDAGIVILVHLDTNENFFQQLKRDPTPQRGIALGLPSLQLAESIAFWILPGIMERFPQLKVLFVEPGLGWLPFLFDTILDGRIIKGDYKFPKLKLLPSEYFKRQMGATFMYEPYGLKVANEYFGPDCLFWSTDFPHPATSWPNSRAMMEKQFSAAGIKTEDRRKMVCDNAIRTFRFK